MKKYLPRIILLILIVVTVGTILIVFLFYKGKLTVTNETKSNFKKANFINEKQAKERVLLLDDSYQSLLHRLNLINQAKKEIYFTTYATHKGESTNVVFGCLLKKANEGVKIHVLLDGKFQGLRKDTLNALSAHNNVEIYLYNRINILKIQYLNAAMHDKILTVDNKYMILGGRNIGDKYYNLETYTGDLTLDREVLVYNKENKPKSVISDAVSYIQSLINNRLSKKRTKKVCKKHNKVTQILIQKYNDFIYQKDITYDYDKITMPTNSIKLITNSINPGKKEPIIAYHLYKLAEESQKIIFQTPYTILTKDNMQLLSNISKKNNFSILTNSLVTSPNVFAFSNYLIKRKAFLKMNVNLYEYTGINGKEKYGLNTSIHAKTLIFDDRITVVGSFNLDERSIRIDTESILVIDSQEFNEYTEEIIKNYLDDSIRVNVNNQYVTNDLSAKLPNLKAKSRLFKLFGFLLRPIEYLL